MSQSIKQTSDDLKDKVYSREEYATASFWQDRYVQNGGFFDWYAEYPELKLAFKEYDILKEDKILMVGCGNSKLSNQMYEDGYHNIVNIDISAAVINQMRQKFPYMVWQVMDATNMTYKDGEFDVILDKGTLDALVSGKNYDICEKMLKQSMRVTKQQGQIIVITYGSPEGRRKIFQNALPFDQNDYYQCRAQLNDLSTMINLMRSNLPGKQLSDILKQQQAFAKTMKQFTIIKLMRKSRKNYKQYIIWSKHDKQQIQINTSHLQQKQIKIEQKTEQKLNEKRQQKTIEKQKIEEVKFNYKPKKQPYVYVYSIRRKFTNGIKQIENNNNDKQIDDIFKIDEDNDYRINGSQNYSINLYLQPHLQKCIMNSYLFLRNKSISYGSCLITSKSQKHHNQQLKIHVISTKNINSFLCLRKTNFNLKLHLTGKTKIECLLQQLTNLKRKLIDKFGLHPSPKVYNLIDLLKNRKIAPTINELLDKYWFPTYKINFIHPQQLNVQISFSPVVEPLQIQIIKFIQTHFKILKPQITNIRSGFISVIDQQLYSIFNMGCLSYSNQKANLVIEDFWQVDQISNEITSDKYLASNLYNQIRQSIFIDNELISRVFAHILAFK